MTPPNIAWTICMILWLICFIISRKFQHNNDIGAAGFFLALEWMLLGFSHGWW